MQIVLWPLNDLLRKQLKSSGVEHMMLERAKIAKNMLSGQVGDNLPTTQLVLAASRKFEKEFHEQVTGILNMAVLWEAFPDDCRTVTQRSLLHRLISRASASVYELLERAHCQYPFKVFSLVECPEEAEELTRAPLCVKDPWTRKLQEQYGTLGHPSVRAILITQRLLQKSDISTIESRHASLRRSLLTRSLQTWRFGVGQCSAEWIMQNSRRLLSQRQMLVKRKVKKIEVTWNRGSPHQHSRESSKALSHPEKYTPESGSFTSEILETQDQSFSFPYPDRQVKTHHKFQEKTKP